MPSQLDDLIVDDRERGLFRVNRRSFTDQDILELERREIFDKVWLYACHESEIATPGSFITRKVGGRPLIVCRDAKGVARAFLNTCPHRGNVVCREKAGKANVFTCFYHAWSFGTDGKLVGLPGEDAYSPHFDRTQMGLPEVVRFENYRGLMFVSFNADIVDLHSYLGAARDRIDCMLDSAGEELEIVGGQQSYSMRANWKLLIENSIDGYHATSTHQRYFRTYLPDIGMDAVDLNAMRASEQIVTQGVSFGGGHSSTESNAFKTPLTKWAKDELAALRGKLETKLGRERAHFVADYNRNLFIFPNLIMITLFHTVRTFYPLAPDYMEIEAWGLLPKNDPVEMRQKRIANFLSFLGPAGFATPDDVSGLEGCQRGFATRKDFVYSDISRGMLSETPTGIDELQMRAFWRQWHHKLQGKSGSADCSDRPQRLVAAE